MTNVTPPVQLLLSMDIGKTFIALRFSQTTDQWHRHIDTAQLYRNEAEVGRAVKDSGVPREEIFISELRFYAMYVCFKR